MVSHQPALNSAEIGHGRSNRGTWGVNRRGQWNTGICECCQDEEICWWTCWCNNMVAARTFAQFQIVRSRWFSILSTAYTSLLVFTLIFGYGGLSIFLLLVGCCVWPCIRAFTRSLIRGKLGINGTILGDYLYHCCSFTSPCATCQEAREARAAGLPLVDFCSGERLPDMSSLIPNTDPVDGSGSSAHGHLDTATGMIMTPDGAWGMTYISITSRIILLVEMSIFLFSVVVLASIGRGRSIIVLIAVFVQPIAVLYFVYWRKQRDTVQLDNIIKLFAVGFFLTTLQSAIFEEIVQTLGLLVFAPLIPSALAPTIADDDQAIYTTYFNQRIGDSIHIDAGAVKTDTDGHADINELFGMVMRRPLLGKRLMNILQMSAQVYTGGIFVDGQINEAYEFRRGDFALSPRHSSILTDTNPLDGSGTEDSASVTLRGLLAAHWPLILVACFFMAFVVAAGVEETMKQFIVRCNRFSLPLSDPYTITTYMLTGALGFTACENMSYVFSVKESPIPGTSILTGEITVLILRVLLPLHLICSVLQGANLSRVVLGQRSDMSLFSMLLSAIALHGSFDCSLFIMAVVSFVNNIDGFWFEITTYTLACLIALGGSWYAYRQHKIVTESWEQGFHQLNDVTQHSHAFVDDRPSRLL